MTKQDITSHLERMEAFEERLGVNLRGLYATMQPPSECNEEYAIEINGELHPTNGSDLGHDLDIVVTLHDSNDRVLSKDTYYVDSDNFFGLEAFEVCSYSSAEPTRIRVYPTKV